ncbi:hypothetical protein PN499_17775, partial [Kamptonema animale CS-326]|uniref:hypothetical protein n=1 Tax=Kamptonema animale TaxID=92934 RepID=UPI00232E2DE8
SAFLYMVRDGDARLLTYFTCFSCTILSLRDRITQTASPPGTDSASPILLRIDLWMKMDGRRRTFKTAKLYNGKENYMFIL